MAARRPVVLVLMGSFWLGGDASGPNQSLRGLCNALGDEFEFRIVARDRPFGATLRTAPLDHWTDLGFARIAYLTAGPFSAKSLRHLLRRTPWDILVLNGMFDRDFTLPTLLMRRAGLIPKRPVLLSPRGEFGAGALSLKAPVKRLWLGFARLSGLLGGVTLHATGAVEAADIAARLPWAAPAVVAPNVRPMFPEPAHVPPAPDAPLRLVFLGRITGVKNLDYALRVLGRVRSAVVYNVYGPSSDQSYADACRALAEALPPHVGVRFEGEIANGDAPPVFAAHDLMFMPTKGENFGHAIFEALASGTPVLISDRTPWRDLEARQAGFDLSLDDPQAFAAAIDAFAALPQADRLRWRAGARRAAEDGVDSAGATAASRAMLRTLRPPHTDKIRVAVVVSHPIQYFTPLYRRLAAAPEIDLEVLFASRIGVETRRDVKMGVDMAWSTDLTGGYRHAFLPGADRIQAASFFEIDNPGVGAALAARNPQVLLLHGYAALTNLKALIWARRHRRPVILVSDATLDAGRGWLRRHAKRVLLRRFSAVLTLSDRGEAYLAGHGVPRSTMFRAPAMIDDGFWQARADKSARRRAARRALGLEDGELALLCVGKLYPGKRVGDVIAALADLERPVRLLVAGDGMQRRDLEAAAAKAKVDASFLGFVNIDALPDIYAAADILVHAAEIEQYGMVLLEAAVLGLPLIVSDRVGAVGETSIVRPEVNALVYPCGDVRALRAAILQLADNPERRAELAAASLAVSEAHAGPASVTAVIAACRFALGRVSNAL